MPGSGSVVGSGQWASQAAMRSCMPRVWHGSGWFGYRPGRWRGAAEERDPELQYFGRYRCRYRKWKTPEVLHLAPQWACPIAIRADRRLAKDLLPIVIAGRVPIGANLTEHGQRSFPLRHGRDTSSHDGI